MITFFTTFRLFTFVEENAIRSWLSLDSKTEVIVFSENKFSIESTQRHRITIISECKRHNSGLPLLNNLFQKASELSRFSMLCYCNSDIIILPELYKIIQPL